MILPDSFHTPVLLPQVLEALRVQKGKKYIDATIGGGGYAVEILKLGGVVLGVDQDIEALDFVKKFRIQNSEFRIGKELFLTHGNFRDLKEIAHSKGFTDVAGIIFDLGMSSYQLEGAGRGFSYQKDELLDMRMNQKGNLTAADILNTYSKDKLYEIFTKYAEELNSGAIVDAIVFTRSLKKIESTSDLVRIIESIVGRNKFSQSTKARIFQALRIAVNDELTNLEDGLIAGINLVEKSGRLVVLSYHSLEDRIVKLSFKNAQKRGTLKILTSTPIRPALSEIRMNSRARSAKLRIAEKIN